jgi:predicted deacetylase
MPSPIIWSVHDATPDSLDRCANLVDLLVSRGVREVAILVVPDRSWSELETGTLRRWEREGHLLGLHGWAHKAMAPRGVYHRLHSAFFSRDAAEHLGRPRAELLDLVQTGVRWFDDAGLAAPRLYVPPAWAMGAMELADVEGMPFRWIETLTGVYDAAARRFCRLPLVGFEADTPLRAWSLRASNRANELGALAVRRPLRAAVHPNDLGLALSGDLRRLLNSCRPSASFADL